MLGLIIILGLILVVFYIVGAYGIEMFSSMSQDTSMPMELLVFVSKSCPHCVNYNTNVHDGIVALSKSKGVKVTRIFPDDDPEKLFDKYEVMFVPTGILLKGGKVYKNLGSNLDPEIIKNAIEM